MPVIDKRRPHRKPFVIFQFPHLVGNFVHHIVPDFALSFDFDNHERSLGADQKIDLASFVALRFVLQIGGRGKHKLPFEPKMREQVVHTVENEILKLQPQNGIPSVQLLKGREFE